MNHISVAVAGVVGVGLVVVLVLVVRLVRRAIAAAGAQLGSSRRRND